MTDERDDMGRPDETAAGPGPEHLAGRVLRRYRPPERAVVEHDREQR